MRPSARETRLVMLLTLFVAGCAKNNRAQDNRPDTDPPPTELPMADATPINKITRASGLIIEDLVVGEGATCLPGAMIRVRYTGRLMNGTVFDSNADSEPDEFPLPQLITGWQEGIPGMRVGGKRRLTIPWRLAYGERGSPPDIPPKADLIFEIELFGTR